MAEFCRECWNKYHPTDPARNYTLSFDKDICEGCGQIKRIVLERKYISIYLAPYVWLTDVVLRCLQSVFKLSGQAIKRMMTQKKK